MVVGAEVPAQPGQLLRREMLVQIPAVDLLRRQVLDRRLHLSQKGGLPALAGSGRRPQVQLADDGLHRHVAGQVPAGVVHQRVHKVVAEHAVEHHVQIVPHRALLLPAVALEKGPGVVVDALPVGGQQARRGTVGKLAQGRVQKAQVHQKGVAGQAQHILGQLVQALFLFGHAGSLLFDTLMLFF